MIANPLVAAVLALALGGCLMPRYLAQAAHGQLELLGRARPIDEVVNDPAVSLRTRMLLSGIADIRTFAIRAGLVPGRAYRNYVEVPASATVWFVGAAQPLAFKPRRWCFPIGGCFTGLGWFDEAEAIAQRDQLRRDGWDAMARPAGAYSTGGWFPDPITSSMLSEDDDAYAALANVVLHESVHATVFVPDQPYFNEGLAEYVGNVLTDQWLIATFGTDSPERMDWTERQTRRSIRTTRRLAAYAELDAVYRSKRSDAEKLQAKTKVIDQLVEDLDLWVRPNNASLIELRVYRSSLDGFARVHAACTTIRRMIHAADRLGRGDFAHRLEEDLTSIFARLERACHSPE